MTITVNNLPPQITEAALTELFSEHGSIQKVELSQSGTVASVKLAGDQEEEAATAALNGTEWHGKTLALELVYDGGGRGTDDPP